MAPPPGLAAQVRDTGTVLGAGAEGVVTVAEQVHDAVAARSYRAVGPIGAPVRAAHAGVASAVFATVRAAHRALPAVAAAAGARLVPAEQSPAGERGATSAVLAAAGGLYGDRLAAATPSLAVETTVRHDGAVVDLTASSLAAAHPDATGGLVVFLHGLCMTERGWQPTTERRADLVDYGRALRRDVGLTPVYVRYTSGRRISDTAADVARLLQELTASWPVPVSSVALVGHSMGGLVARSACHQAAEAELPWIELVSHVVTLGTPHLGAPLEKGVNAASWALRRFPESRPFARLLDARSAGIKDLRYGALLRADWEGHDPDELLRDRCGDMPFLPHARHHYVASMTARAADGPWGHVVGDLLVGVPSATGAGRRRRLAFADGDGVLLRGVDHLRLLHHPDVYAELRRWLTPRPEDAV